MTDILIGLPAVALVAFALGAGWAAVLRRAAPPGLFGFVFFAWSSAIVLTSVVWAWAYPTGLDVRFGIAANLLLSGIGYAVALQRGAFHTLHLQARVLTGLILPIGVTVVALVPAVSSINHLSVGVRTGPDAAGYAISARAISDGLTRPTIERNLLTQVGGGRIDSVVSPGSKLVDTTPSVTTQAQAEFLVGADRWGFAGAVGSVLFLIGAAHLWSMLSLLAALALLTACAGAWSIVQGLTKSTWAATVTTVLIGMSPSLLDSWHEGALAQIWVLPACVLLFWPLLQLGEGDRLGGAVAVGLGLACILPAFNDALLIYAIVFALTMALSIPLLRRAWWRTWWPLMTGAVAGAALVAMATAAFLVTLARSLHEIGTAGWSQPRWLGPAEAFGLHNAYGSAVPSLETRSVRENVLLGGEDALVGGLLLALVYRRLRQPAVVLLGAILVATVGVYVKTRYLDHATNYQYFKTIALLTPVGALAVGMLLGNALTTPRRPRSDTPRHGRQRPARARSAAVLVMSAIVMVAVVSAAASYVVTYRSEGTTVPTAFAGLAGSPSASAVFNQYNLLAPVDAFPPRTAQARLLAFDVGAEVNVNWIGRNVGQPTTRMENRISHPVGLLVFEQDCPRFRCLSGIPPDQIPFHQDGVAIVRLSPDARPLTDLPEQNWPVWAANRFRDLGGIALVGLVPQAQPDGRR